MPCLSTNPITRLQHRTFITLSEEEVSIKVISKPSSTNFCRTLNYFPISKRSRNGAMPSHFRIQSFVGRKSIQPSHSTEGKPFNPVIRQRKCHSTNPMRPPDSFLAISTTYNLPSFPRYPPKRYLFPRRKRRVCLLFLKHSSPATSSKRSRLPKTSLDGVFVPIRSARPSVNLGIELDYVGHAKGSDIRKKAT